MKLSKRQKIIKAIEDEGCLLVYPLGNRKEPRSIWSALYPRTAMRWEWDEDGDNRVGELWALRTELSQSRVPLLRDSQEALDILFVDSPQSTPTLKENLGLRGKLLEGQYNRTLKPLWNYLYLVGFGETEDSSFPSLNVGATATLFEELWLKSQEIPGDKAEAKLRKILGDDNLFFKYAQKLRAALA